MWYSCLHWTSKCFYEIVIKGLQRLEYRGYDSSGVAIHNSKKVNVFKQKGKVQDLIDFAANKDTKRKTCHRTY